MVKSLLACTVRRDKLADLRQNKLKQIKHFLKNVGKNNKRNKNEMRGVWQSLNHNDRSIPPNYLLPKEVVLKVDEDTEVNNQLKKI